MLFNNFCFGFGSFGGCGIRVDRKGNPRADGDKTRAIRGKTCSDRPFVPPGQLPTRRNSSVLGHRPHDGRAPLPDSRTRAATGRRKTFWRA